MMTLSKGPEASGQRRLLRCCSYVAMAVAATSASAAFAASDPDQMPIRVAAMSQDTPTAGAQAPVQQDAKQADPGELEADPDDIVVTARRRQETSIEVPVSVTALGQEQLERQGVRSFADVALLVPSLTVGQVSGGAGGTVVLRGVGTAAGTNPSFEQTVSINIDGVQLSRGAVQRLGQIDLGAIEVLRGPQALFFGKNSPAGVISFRSADPTNSFEAMTRGAYEVGARQATFDAVLSGPVSDTLKLRFAGSGSKSQGWFINDAHKAVDAVNAIRPNSVYSTVDRGPKEEFYFGRFTALFNPTDKFSVRGKFSYAETNGISFQHGGNQIIYCPNGTRNLLTQVSGFNTTASPVTPATRAAIAAAAAVDDCRADKHYTAGDINPTTIALASTGAFALKGIHDTQGDAKASQILGSVELNYAFTESLKLTSVSGWAKIHDYLVNAFSYGPTDASPNVDFEGDHSYDQLSQEFRLASDFEGPVNGLIGGYYENSKLRTHTRALNGSLPPIDQFVKTTAMSAFAQAMWNITPQVELSGGARWSRETKNLRVMRGATEVTMPLRDAAFNNISPEVSLSYRPTENMNFYVAYKQGFKSGGFATPFTGGALPATVLSGLYQPETAKGGEIGAKARLLNGRLRVNLAGYHYDYTNLQVNSLDNTSGFPVIKVTNAAAARIKGLEADFAWRPEQIAGLNIHGAVSYGNARYTDFATAPCYIGQTAAEGCRAVTGGTIQSHTGKQLVNAPDWAGSMGYDYSTDLNASGLSLGFSQDLSYKSSYQPHADLVPEARQAAGVFLNSSIRLRSTKGWEIALVGKNLTDLYRVTTATNATLTGNAALNGTTTTGGRADLAGSVNRGREIWLQVTLRPSEW